MKPALGSPHCVEVEFNADDIRLDLEFGPFDKFQMTHDMRYGHVR